MRPANALAALGFDAPDRSTVREWTHAGNLAALGLAAAIVVLTAAWIIVSKPDLWRASLAAVVLVNLLVFSVRWPGLAVIGAFLFLPFVALIRRLLIKDTGFTSQDPLLLVAPLLAVVFLMRFWLFEKRPILTDRLSRFVFALLVVAVAQVFNPLGAGVKAGAVGLLFVGVPLLWFFVGREVGNRRTNWIILGLVMAVAIAVAAYGLWQTEIRSVLPSWDKAWFDTNGYSALVVGNSYTKELRPFSTFSSNAEYGIYVGMGAVIAVAFALHRRWWALVALPLFFPAVFFAGSRGIMVLGLAGILVAFALKVRTVFRAWVIVIVGVAAVIGVTSVLSSQLVRAAGRSGDPLATRTVGGLTNPLDDKTSSLSGHWANLTSAVETGFTHPLGSGAGATNLAADQLASGRVETDNDLADAFRNFGFVGGLLLFAIIVVGLSRVGGRAIRNRDPVAVAVGALMIVNLGFWLKGGYYATSALMWFLLGAATRPQEEETAGYVTSMKRRRGTSVRPSSTLIPPAPRPVTAAAPNSPVSGS